MNTRGTHRDPHLTLPRVWIREFLVAQVVGRAEVVLPDDMHRATPAG
jgi:hypothetical protein